MKCWEAHPDRLYALSLPVWGEWIEITSSPFSMRFLVSLSPCGESGLKSMYHACNRMWIVSLPVWGEWIEIGIGQMGADGILSLPVWGEWIEIYLLRKGLGG